MRGVFSRFGLQAVLGFLLAGSVITACTHALSQEQLEYHAGTLYLRGNAPFISVVLEERPGKQWELIGMDQKVARDLQNRHVEVKAFRAEPIAPLNLPRLFVREWHAPDR